MARHNRDARGTDQRGYDYDIGYQPDWVKLIKVTRELETGRQSTKTLFKNPSRREQPPGPRVRTRITSKEQNLDFSIEVDDPQGVITRIIVVTEPASVERERLEFTIEDRLPRSPDED